MKIVLLRHGEPDFDFAEKVKAREIHKLVESYNACGIKDHPPVGVAEKVQQCKIVVCSNLPRSIQSAEALGVDKVHVSDSLFREAGLPYARWGLISISPRIWAVLFRALWFIGFSANGESFISTKQRAGACAQRLAEIAKEHESVLFIGHGFINRFIAKELLSKGWEGPTNPGKYFWEYGVYRYNAT